MASASEGFLSVSLASVVEDVLKEHGTRFSDTNLASRKADEAAARRNEAAEWLRMVLGVVAAKGLPNEPSEEELRLGLRNGIILCNALNKVQPGAVPKVVANPGDTIQQPDGAALSAYQYFENVRNFLVSAQEMGLPTFEASDLEQGGKSARIIDCVLSLKSYAGWKRMGGHGTWKSSANLKPSNSSKHLLRKNSENSKSSLLRSQSMSDSDHLRDAYLFDGDVSAESSETITSGPLNMLVHAALSNKKPEELPMLVESLLNKVMEEFEHRIVRQNKLVNSISKDNNNCTLINMKASIGPLSSDNGTEEIGGRIFINSKEQGSNKMSKGEMSKEKILMRQLICNQDKAIQELKHALQSTKVGIEVMHMMYTDEFNKLGESVHGLSNAASGYHNVLEENRKLYNQVQDLKGSIRVYCRVRPFLAGQLSNNCIGSFDEGSISIITPSKNGKEGRRSFNFNKVFGPSATQEQVFSDTQPLIRSILDGYNVCIFAYGQTGSGKTYTMSGPKLLNEQTFGVNYRALSDLFKLAEQRRSAFSYEIAVQMIEIYNEQVRDLLNEGINKRLEIRNTLEKGLNVPNANLVPVASTSDVMALMNIGQKNRVVGSTALNDRSSRSHSCLTVHVQGRDMTSETVLRGCLHLVDLAGSERVDKSEVTGERLKEAQHINKSLSALGDVISALAQKSSHVPYRNSKLTQLLQDSLGGQAKTLMFVHISPEMDTVGETLSTLKFAERVSTVELGAAQVNKESGEVKALRQQIASLKEALARKETDHQNVLPSPDPIHIATPSPVHPSRQSSGAYLSSQTTHRQPMEEVRNIEVRGNVVLRRRVPSFDLQDLLTTNDSFPWPLSSSRMNHPNKDDKQIVYNDWVDKVMVNKQDTVATDGNSMIDWDGSYGTSPDIFYHQSLSDMRVHPDEQFHKKGITGKDSSYEMNRQRKESFYAATDGSDDLDVATSDSSEAEMLWQFNLQNVHNTYNESGSNIKKPQTKTPDIRIPNQAKLSSSKKSNAPNRIGRPTNSSSAVDRKHQ
ncbi:kinesin-like protein KIN-14F [Zingiber officinale]|uniref:kinesin-like protein KIN-14F n=1 Tax=Zingiber officinale TaxID=94328 RepID=UPI001C4D7F41|nr:kinesin-like protein KIN-14F [Zingiber officinale]